MSVKIVTHSPAVAYYLKGGGGVREVLEASGQRMSTAAGEGVEAETFIGRHRMRVTVSTRTVDAIIREAHDHTLTSALDAGRG